MAIEDGLLTVAAVARRLGVAPATLRTWDRRYDLGPSTHERGEHRRYCALDVAKLMLMRRLIASGVAPCEAARKAKNQNCEESIESVNFEFEAQEELVSAIFRAANSCDVVFIENELRKAILLNGIPATWSQVIVPVLNLIGCQWEDTGQGIEVEHIFTEILIRVLRNSVSDLKDPLNHRPVLLAAVGKERHTLALHALAATLAERKIGTFFLGSCTPLEAVSGMVKRSAPPAIFLWAQLKENAQSEYFLELPVVRPAPRIILGGPGWNRDSCTGVALVEDIRQACLEIERAVGV